jgi:hypothetical protein
MADSPGNGTSEPLLLVADLVTLQYMTEDHTGLSYVMRLLVPAAFPSIRTVRRRPRRYCR